VSRLAFEFVGKDALEHFEFRASLFGVVCAGVDVGQEVVSDF
jgi:hypothetical protein